MTDGGKQPVLRTEHLGRAGDGHVLVEDISIEVPQGDILAIVGPSGSGKSSFLRMLNRLDEPTSGEVFLRGQNTREMSPRRLRQRVGMVMQSANLFPGTVADNIRYGPAQREISWRAGTAHKGTREGDRTPVAGHAAEAQGVAVIYERQDII